MSIEKLSLFFFLMWEREYHNATSIHTLNELGHLDYACFYFKNSIFFFSCVRLLVIFGHQLLNYLTLPSPIITPVSPHSLPQPPPVHSSWEGLYLQETKNETINRARFQQPLVVGSDLLPCKFSAGANREILKLSKQLFQDQAREVKGKWLESWWWWGLFWPYLCWAISFWQPRHSHRHARAIPSRRTGCLPRAVIFLT